MDDKALVLRSDAAILQDAQTDTNPAAVYLSGLAPSGRRTMAGVLGKVADMAGGYDVATMPWAALRYEHVAAIRQRLSETLAPATVNKTLCAIRGVLRAAWQMGQMDAESYHRAVAVKSVTGTTLPAGRAIAQGELAAIMGACADGTPAGARDAAIIALGYAAGLRRAELAGLTLDNLETPVPWGGDGDTITLRLVGKRHRERLAYVDNGAMLAVRAWLKVRGDAEGPLFYAGHKGGHLHEGQGMTPQAIRDVVVRRAKQAGVDNVTPHDLRRSFVSDLLDAGADISTVAAMAGHASVQTTARYDRRGEAAKRKAAKTLHVPYDG